MPFAGSQVRLDAAEIGHRALQPFDDDARFLGGDAAGAAVGEIALGVGGGEVAARDDVARADVHARAQRFEHAAADLPLG
jgi:hypothetical protein